MTTIRAPRARLTSGLAAVAIAVAATVAAPVTSSASATGCVSGTNPNSCVAVNGASTYVESVAGGVYLDSNASAVGHFHVYGAGIDFRSSDARYTAGFFDHERYGPPFSVKRDLPDGSRVCAEFLEDTRHDGSYVYHSPACETIHR